MALSMSTYLPALYAAQAAPKIDKSIETSMKRISTGLRVNEASDDVASTGVISRISSEVRGAHQSLRNAMNAKSLVETAEAAHKELGTVLQAMKEIAITAISDSNNIQDRKNLQMELDAIKLEIDRVASVTSWAGQNLIDETGSSFSFQVGASSAAASRVKLDLNPMDAQSIKIYGQDPNITTPKALGSEFVINNSSTLSNSNAAVSALADGSFAVAWQGSRSGDDQTEIYGQKFDSSANPVGDEFRISTPAVGEQNYSSIAGLAEGQFVATWEGLNADGVSGHTDIYSQVYDEKGMAVGSANLINTVRTDGNQGRPDITALEYGGFVAIWHGENSSGDLDVYGKVFNSAGVALGDEFVVNVEDAGAQKFPAVASLSDGGFLINWASTSTNNADNSVYGRAYNSTGVAQGSQFLLNSFTGSETLSVNNTNIKNLTQGTDDNIGTFTFDGSFTFADGQRATLGTAGTKAESIVTINGSVNGATITKTNVIQGTNEKEHLFTPVGVSATDHRGITQGSNASDNVFTVNPNALSAVKNITQNSTSQHIFSTVGTFAAADAENIQIVSGPNSHILTPQGALTIGDFSNITKGSNGAENILTPDYSTAGIGIAIGSLTNISRGSGSDEHKLTINPALSVATLKNITQGTDANTNENVFTVNSGFTFESEVNVTQGSGSSENTLTIDGSADLTNSANVTISDNILTIDGTTTNQLSLTLEDVALQVSITPGSYDLAANANSHSTALADAINTNSTLHTTKGITATASSDGSGTVSLVRNLTFEIDGNTINLNVNTSASDATSVKNSNATEIKTLINDNSALQNIGLAASASADGSGTVSLSKTLTIDLGSGASYSASVAALSSATAQNSYATAIKNYINDTNNTAWQNAGITATANNSAVSLNKTLAIDVGGGTLISSSVAALSSSSKVNSYAQTIANAISSDSEGITAGLSATAISDGSGVVNLSSAVKLSVEGGIQKTISVMTGVGVTAKNSHATAIVNHLMDQTAFTNGGFLAAVASLEPGKVEMSRNFGITLDGVVLNTNSMKMMIGVSSEARNSQATALKDVIHANSTLRTQKKFTATAHGDGTVVLAKELTATIDSTPITASISPILSTSTDAEKFTAASQHAEAFKTALDTTSLSADGYIATINENFDGEITIKKNIGMALNGQSFSTFQINPGDNTDARASHATALKSHMEGVAGVTATTSNSAAGGAVTLTRATSLAIGNASVTAQLTTGTSNTSKNDKSLTLTNAINHQDSPLKAAGFTANVTNNGTGDIGLSVIADFTLEKKLYAIPVNIGESNKARLAQANAVEHHVYHNRSANFTDVDSNLINGHRYVRMGNDEFFDSDLNDGELRIVKAGYVELAGVPTGDTFAIAGTHNDVKNMQSKQLAAHWMNNSALTSQHINTHEGEANSGSVKVTVSPPVNPDVVALKDGSLISTWTAYGPETGNELDVLAQRFSTAGQKNESEFVVNSVVLDNNQEYPSIAALADGGYVTAWHGKNSNGNSDVYGKRFDANSDPVGSDFVVNSALIAPTLGSLKNLTPGSGAAINSVTVDGAATLTNLSNIQLMHNHEYLLQITDNSTAVQFDIEGHTVSAQAAAGAAAQDIDNQAQSLINSINGHSNLDALGIKAYHHDGQNGVGNIQLRRSLKFVLAGETFNVGVFTGVSDLRKDRQARDLADQINSRTNLKNVGISANASTDGSGTLAVWRDQKEPSVTALANGDFVTTWQSNKDDGSAAIYGQLFDTGFTTTPITHETLARKAITQIDSAMSVVNNQQSQLGAYSNRLNGTIKNLTNTSSKMSATKDRIERADLALETTRLVRSQMLQNITTVMMASSNISNRHVLSLLLSDWVK